MLKITSLETTCSVPFEIKLSTSFELLATSCFMNSEPVDYLCLLYMVNTLVDVLRDEVYGKSAAEIIVYQSADGIVRLLVPVRLLEPVLF